MNKTLKFAAAVVALALALPAMAGTDMHDSKDMKAITPPECSPKTWTLELGSGALFSNVRDDAYAGYTMVPIQLTAGLAVDDVSLDNVLGGVFRGYTEFLFRGEYNVITHSPGENWFAGVMVGPRYNFVQPGWKVIPYVEGTVGVGFADSHGGLTNQNGLGQDFNFTFEAGAGAKYQINCDWSVRLGVQYKHISSAGLSDPLKNNPIDAIGPVVGTFDGGRSMLEAVTATGATGLVAFNDVQAAGFLVAARDAGIAVPGDISVVGSDGLDLAAMTGPPLTTVAAQLAQIGAAALARLADLMATRDGPQRTVLQPSLVPRSSTATPPPAPTTRHRPRS